MKWTVQCDKSPAWTEELSKQSSDGWFDALQAFCGRDLKEALGTGLPPAFQRLGRLPFQPDEPGVYAGLLKPTRSSDATTSHVLIGCAAHRPVSSRTIKHDSPSAKDLFPDMKYYQLRHGTKDYTHRFVTLVRIPIRPNMTESEQARRRLLCRLAECFFTVWTVGSDPDKPRAQKMLEASRDAYAEAYDCSVISVDWSGLASHCPLRETTGTAEKLSERSRRYDESIEALLEIYGIFEEIPEELLSKVKSRSEAPLDKRNEWKDQRKRSMSAEDITDEYRKAKKQKQARLDGMTEQARGDLKQSTREYFQAYNENRLNAMTETEREADKLDKATATRKHRVSKAFEAGILTQAQVDDARSKDWYAQPGWPKRWSRAPSKMAQKAKKAKK